MINGYVFGYSADRPPTDVYAAANFEGSEPNAGRPDQMSLGATFI